MHISPINSNSTTFNGYTNIKVRRFVNEYKKSNLGNINIDKGAAMKITVIGGSYDKLHNSMNLLMDELHSKTRLTVGGKQVKEFQITNPITKKKLIFWKSDKQADLGNIKNNRILVSKTLPNNATAARSLAHDLSKINPKEVDRFFYDSAIRELEQKASEANNYFNKLKLRRYINRILKYKKQCNIVSPETKESLLKKVNDAFTKLQTKEI